MSFLLMVTVMYFIIIPQYVTVDADINVPSTKNPELSRVLSSA